MSEPLLASIFISSYNYGRFLREAIDSALGQTYPHTEVIVVDDASTDDSPEIIASYGGRIISVLREKNLGSHASYAPACELSRGEVLFLLDSDDVMDPTAVERTIPYFQDPEVFNVHHPLWEIDAHGRRSGRIVGHAHPQVDLRELVIREGPGRCDSVPTSGHAWSRAFLERVLPMPAHVRSDAYGILLACLHGRVVSLPEPSGCYRVHGQNDYVSRALDERLAADLRHDEICYRVLEEYCRSHGIAADPAGWERNSWNHQLSLTIEQLKGVIPEGDTLILVDGDMWGTGGRLAGRRVLPIVEHEGRYWGEPADDRAAIAELERLRSLGAGFVVFPWPTFWWLEHYAGLAAYLRSRSRVVLESDRLIVFQLSDA